MGKRRKKSTVKKFGKELFGGILIVLGLILFVFLTFSNVGVIAEFIKSVLTGLFSKTAILFPLILIILGGRLIVSEENLKITNELIKGLIALIFIAATLSSFFDIKFNIFNDILGFSSNSYNYGIKGSNIAGLLGANLAAISISLIGILASRILLIFLSIISILFFLDVSLNEFFEFIKNTFSHIFDAFSSLFSVLFRKKEENEDNNKADSKKQKLQDKMLEKGNVEADKNLRTNNLDQLEFDLNKLGAPQNENEIKAKQQRDDFFRKQKEEKEDKNVKEVLTLDHAKLAEEQNYIFPPFELLGEKFMSSNSVDKRAIQHTAIKLQKTLASFGVEAKVTNITKGPTVTRYELTPNTGVKVSRIVSLADDIALNLAAKSIRIEAPIPGKAAVGIEVPNPVPDGVSLREVLESDAFQDGKASKVSFAVGKDAAGDIVIGDIAKMPHVLIAGATGSGKSVCINSLIVSILYKAKPSEVKLILIDPKMVELSGYNGLPHLLIPVVTDPKKAAGALNWAVQEMVNRYKLFASHGVKDIKGYNQIIENEIEGAKLPQIVVIIDELADLMMVAPNDVEDAICRLAQMARAAGMHLVVATQRPSVDVVTGIIKANIPSRIAFTTSSQVDSRTILDMAGAEKLLGKGDMLYFPVGENKPLRVQGAFISEKNIESIVEYIKSNSVSTYNDDIIESIEKSTLKGTKSSEDDDKESEDADALLEQAIDLVVDMGQASASMLQRRFKIGYSRAGRIIDQMEIRGLISGYDGSKPRQILISKDEWQELKLANSDNPDNVSTEVNN